MPTFRYGDMMKAFGECDHFIFTGNAFIKRNGALVMGAGIAKSVRDRWNGIDIRIGKRISHLSTYGVVIGSKIGVFQVKYHFKDPAELDLVKLSTNRLTKLAKNNPSLTYFLNFPAIGNGKLKLSEVMPIVNQLPDNVHIWRFKRS